MMDFKNGGPGWNRNPSDHRRQRPETKISRGPEAIHVKLKSYSASNGRQFAELYNQYQASYGEHPSKYEFDTQLNSDDWDRITDLVKGGMVSAPLEAIQFSFEVNGVSRACTHQIVRSRIGASFAQQSGRANDMRHRSWILPETIARLLEGNWKEKQYDAFHQYGFDLEGESPMVLLEDLLERTKHLYAVLVDLGIPHQDARRVLPIGLTTFIHCNYTWPALKSFVATRTEHGQMDWEIDCVAQLMRREVIKNCHWCFGNALLSHSDRAKKDVCACRYEWPPCGKHPTPDNYDPEHPTYYDRDQMPYWVLDPNCVYGDDPVRWIQSNGHFPHAEIRESLTVENDHEKES